jgi:SAM-dependent methyltransferase
MRLDSLEDMHSTYDSMRDFWAAHWSATKFDEEYQTNFHPRRQEEFKAIIEQLPRNEVVLEAGCSFGHVAEYFRKSGYQVVGLDYVFDALGVGRVCAPDLTLLQADIHALPMRDNSIGGYLSFGVLEHFDFGPIPALKEAFRVLKPGGVVAVTMPLPSPLVRDWIPRLRPWMALDPLRRNGVLRRLFRRAPLIRESSNGDNGFYEQPYSPAEVRTFLEQSGFRVLRQMPIYHSYWLWLTSGVFRERDGYHQPNKRAERVARVLKKQFPWSTAFFSLAIAEKPCL